MTLFTLNSFRVLLSNSSLPSFVLNIHYGLWLMTGVVNAMVACTLLVPFLPDLEDMLGSLLTFSRSINLHFGRHILSLLRYFLLFVSFDLGNHVHCSYVKSQALYAFHLTFLDNEIFHSFYVPDFIRMSSRHLGDSTLQRVNVILFYLTVQEFPCPVDD